MKLKVDAAHGVWWRYRWDTGNGYWKYVVYRSDECFWTVERRDWLRKCCEN